MLEDGGTRMKSRLRSDLRTAMKSRRKGEATLIRELVAALDNAEAVPGSAELTSLVRHEFRSGSAEVERLVLNDDHVRDLLLMEIQKREQAAAEMERLGEVKRAHTLRTEALMAKRYVE